MTTGTAGAASPTTGLDGPGIDIVWHDLPSRAERWARLGMWGATVWFTGLSGAGKSTLAVEVQRQLVAAGTPATVLDGDNLRHGLTRGLTFSPADRAENVRRVGEAAALVADAGVIALVSLVSPFRADRDAVRAVHDRAGLRFAEVWVATSLERCEARDPKGLYARARAGSVIDLTGVSAPYEEPLDPELVVGATDDAAAALAARVVDWLAEARAADVAKAARAGS